MLRQEFFEWLESNGFIKKNASTYAKKYKLKDEEIESRANTVTIEYKINKDVVNVYYYTIKGKIKRMKSKLSKLSTDEDGVISGFKVLE